MSQARVCEETIDDVTYRMRPLPPRVALRLLHRILQIAAPGLGKTIDNVGGNLGEVMKTSIDSIGFGELIAGALERMTDKDLDWANDLLAKQCEVVMGPDKAPRLVDIFDAHFQGRIRHWFSWVSWATKNQFADFFDAPAKGDAAPV